MTTIQSGNLKCMTCGAVHLIDHPIATQRLSQLHEAFKVLNGLGEKAMVNEYWMAVRQGERHWAGSSLSS